MNNVEALKALFAALGGTPSDVAGASTIVEVLNAIAGLYKGATNATQNAEAIMNIANVAENIASGNDEADAVNEDDKEAESENGD